MAGDQQAGKPEAAGPFRLVGELGVGALGSVYLGESAGGHLVAVRIIRPELARDPRFRERFAREVTAAMRVGGLSTAAVVDADLDGSRPWLATAYVAGPSLARVVEQNGPLPPASVGKLAAGLAEGLQQVHEAGIVHRDLKPSNVLLSADGPRIIDFGISRAAEATALTGAGPVAGSPYMSPEQAAGERVGPASDVFSLGAVLFYAATGETPFGDGPFSVQLNRLIHEQPRLDRVPAAIRPLIEHALAKQPQDRPSLAQFVHSSRPPDEQRPVPGDLGFAESRGGPMQPRPQPGSSGGLPQGTRRKPGWRKREKPGHGAVSLPATGLADAAREREPRQFQSSTGQLRNLAARVFGWLIPPGALTVSQADPQAQQDQALRYIEAEIDRAYSALGLPPGLEGPVQGGRSDVKRD